MFLEWLKMWLLYECNLKFDDKYFSGDNLLLC